MGNQLKDVAVAVAGAFRCLDTSRPLMETVLQELYRDWDDAFYLRAVDAGIPFPFFRVVGGQFAGRWVLASGQCTPEEAGQFAAWVEREMSDMELFRSLFEPEHIQAGILLTMTAEIEAAERMGLDGESSPGSATHFQPVASVN